MKTASIVVATVAYALLASTARAATDDYSAANGKPISCLSYLSQFEGAVIYNPGAPRLTEAQALADRVAIIKDGQILAEGPPASLGAGASRSFVSWRSGDGELHTRETDDATTLLHELTGEALARGERLEDLSVTRPSLEEVYLELTAEADSR